MGEKVVLAFSGGLDTSYCVLDLVSKGFEVHSVFVDTGGMNEASRAEIKQKALALGATQHHELDVSRQIWEEFVIPLVWSHARMLGEYPLLCSDRYLIVRHCLKLCDELGTRNFAHGCTGMGNDQMRFDQTVRSLGDYDIIAPIRDLQSEVDAVRDFEIGKMKQAGFDVEESSSRYSINENLLGVTISGSEIDEYKAPADDAWTITRDRKNWPTEPVDLTIGFHRGVATELNGEKIAGPDLLRRLNRILGSYGIGRHIYTGDVTIGLKGRIAFECPGIDGLLTAHQALEDVVNTRFQNQFRQVISQRWAELVYAGFFYEPQKADLEAYLCSAQQYVSGTVRLTSNGGSLLATEVDSEYRIHNPDAVYAQRSDWTPEEALGFIKLTGQSSTLAARIRKARS